MAKQLTDDEVNLRRKARQRLIGAVVLTLAVVVVLPMVLDNDPKPVSQDIELRIPAPDKAGEFSPEGTPSRTKEAASAVTTTFPVAASGVIEALSAASKVGAAPTEIAAPYKTSGNGQANAAGSGESFVVQVGAYSNADAAKQEASRLKKMGFKAYTEKVNGKVRVRVGPYTERSKAEKVRQLLENHGLHPVVISTK